jgi:hypothetical protein
MPKNKKTIKKKNLSKKTLIILLVLIIAVAGFFIWRHYHNQAKAKANAIAADEKKSNSTINYSPSTPADNAANNSRKTSTNPAQTLVNGASATSSVPLSVTVTRAGVVGSNLEVGTLVNGASSGSCTLNVSQSGQSTVTKTEDVQVQNNAYTCPVFDIPVSGFPNKNNWNVSVTVTSSGRTVSGQWQANPVNLSNNG